MLGSLTTARIGAGLSLALAALCCAAPQGTDPHDMSAAKHDTAAGAERAREAGHAAHRYDPAPRPCPAASASDNYEGVAICWSETSSAQHSADAERHRELAQRHRDAAQSLRDAEARSCAGLAEADRVTSPFYHREDIARVERVDVPGPIGSDQVTRLAGAKVVFRAVPGLTADRLQALVDCHIARAAALGHDVEGMEYCPLGLEGVRAQVAPADDGLAVEIVSDDAATAATIVQRVTPSR